MSKIKSKRKSLLNFFFTLIGLLLFSSSVFAIDRILDVTTYNQSFISLTDYFGVWEDVSKTASFDEIQKPEIEEQFKTDFPPSEALNYGYTASAYWLRLHLKNSSDKTVKRMLEIAYPPLADIQFYQLSEHHFQLIQTGYSVPFSQRPYKYRCFVFPISIAANSNQTVYLRIQTPNSMNIPARLWAESDFLAYERKDNIIQAMYFGAISVMILYNLFLFSVLRESSYLLYVLFSIFTTLSMIFYAGISNELFPWSDKFFITKIGTSVATSFTLTFFLLFMRQMLNTAIILPKFDVVIKLFVIINALMPIFLLMPIGNIIKYKIIILGITVFLILIVIFICTLKRQRSAYFFMAAFGFLFVTILSISLSALSILSSNLVSSTWKLQFGSALEMLLLAFSLSDRFNVIRLEKEKAQTNLLQTQQLLVENLKLSEHILEARVLERTKELEIVNLQLKALSTTDALTGIANRRHFDDVLAVEWERAKRQNKPLALGLLDVDWFKKYNDHYGHQMGDECLKNVAAVLKSSICRTGDLVARYGGEEFVFIAPATDCNAALKMAQKIREEFEKRALPHELSDFGFVSASIGITCVIPNENLQSKDLVKIADEALYLAKEQGRNRVVAKINENEITLTG